jgi:hypothetical protein
MTNDQKAARSLDVCLSQTFPSGVVLGHLESLRR